MKQVMFVFNELTIVCNILSDFCQIIRCGIPIWAGGHEQLIELLEEVNSESA